MTKPRRYCLFRIVLSGLAALLATGLVNPAVAQDEKETGWFFTADFTAVWTGGNSESNTFGTTGTLLRVWPKSSLKLEGGGTQTQSTIRTWTARGTTDDFVVDENKVTEKTAELYFATGRYDHQVHKRFLLFGGVDWLRNTFSGIDSRFLVAVGAGNTWTDDKKTKFITDYSFTYTFQDEVVNNPLTKNEFPGLRLGYDFWWKVSESTEFTSVFTGDLNLDNTDDIRVDVVFTLPVSISEKLALKPAYRLLWRNDPALTEIPLYTPEGVDTEEKVLTPLDELDTIFTLALVLSI
jgi:putative salt-induced outer membrane protein YdiY